MQNPTTILHGIPNCDTVKKARAWLQARGVPHVFHDFKKLGVPPDRLPAWLAAVGGERLLNRQGTTWRRLDASAQARASDVQGLAALLAEQPSLIKRPVVEWSDGAVTVGFAEAAWNERLRACSNR